jgi:hypothetical protein
VQISESRARPVGSRVVSLIVLIVGLGLLGGAAAAYYYIVQRPLAWPKADAVVVSSRVVNPKGPSDHQPEIVFRLAPDAREVRTIAPWSSGSYDMVRAYVDPFPAGTALPVAVNPADPSDVRHELGPTFTNVIVPGVIGLMGVIFAGVGVIALLWRPRSEAAAGRATLRWVSALFIVIGLIIGGIGAWLFTGETPLSWPTIEAEALGGAVREESSSSPSRSSQRTYDIQVTFRYMVNGQAITSQTTSGSGSSSRSAAESRLEAYSPGSRHVIRYRPDDPNVIRFEVTPFKVYVLPGALVAMGVVFAGLGVLTLKLFRR